MEKEFDILVRNDDDEEVIVAPYYFVTYVDDQSHTHLATVKEEWYLDFLKDRYEVKDCRYVGVEDNREFDNIEK